MSLKKTTQRGHSTMSELNITPLLDLVFVLLVIFIITTPQLVNNLEINLPAAKPPAPEHKPKPAVNRIGVSAQGQITVNNTLVTGPQLKGALQSIKDANPDPSFVIKGADEVDYQVMVLVLDTLQQLQISKVGLATD